MLPREDLLTNRKANDCLEGARGDPTQVRTWSETLISPATGWEVVESWALQISGRCLDFGECKCARDTRVFAIAFVSASVPRESMKGGKEHRPLVRLGLVLLVLVSMLRL